MEPNRKGKNPGPGLRNLPKSSLRDSQHKMDDNKITKIALLRSHLPIFFLAKVLMNFPKLKPGVSTWLPGFARIFLLAPYGHYVLRGPLT